jgi:hypothetical protein
MSEGRGKKLLTRENLFRGGKKNSLKPRNEFRKSRKFFFFFKLGIFKAEIKSSKARKKFLKPRKIFF